MIHINLHKVMLMGLWGIATAMTLTSCVDDHFTIPEGSEEGGVATQSLWELIANTPELSNFATIAEKTPMFKDEKHIIENYTIKDVLNSNIVLTVFAPDNEAFTQTEVQEYEALLQESPYDAFLRLTGNHISRNRYVASGPNPQGKAERLIFINNKQGIFDREAKTIKDVPLKTPNLSATNGVLHIIGQQIPFAYNIYEYIRASKNHKHLNKWISQHDTLYFNSNLSAIAGTNPETGEPVYVDSVYSRFNSLYYYSYQPASAEWSVPHKGISCNIEQEDSIWAMVLPSDAAWEEAYQTMQPWYTYAEKYIDMSEEDALKKDYANAGTASRPLITVKDTVQEAAISMDLVSPLVFNVRMQKRLKGVQEDFWTIETFKNNKITKLFNTRLDTFTIDKDESEDVRNLLFEGKEPIEVSNGLIYPVDHWNYRKTYKALNVEVKAAPSAIYQNNKFNLTTSEQGSTDYSYYGDYEQKSFDNSSELAKKYGIVSKSSYLVISKSSGQPKVTFKLRGNEEDQQVLSGIDYEVGVVLVPAFYLSNKDPEEAPEAIKKNRLTVSITYVATSSSLDINRNREKTWSSQKFDYNGEKVDTIWMTKNNVRETFRFPFSYRNITKAYPVVTVASDRVTPNMEKQGFQYDFYIDRIILRPKSE